MAVQWPARMYANGSISTAGGINDDIKAELASHAEQLSDNLFSRFTRDQESSVSSDGGTSTSNEGKLLRWVAHYQ